MPARSLPVIVLLLSLAAMARGEDPPSLVFIQAGELPIILSAPHGGKLAIPDVDERQRNDRPTGGAGFVVARDGGTEELAHEVAKAVETHFGRKPWVVISRAHRKYLDPNRPPGLAYDDPDAKPVYEAYHGALAKACKSVQDKFIRGLLLDIHGQGTAADTVFRGTQNGKTVKLLAERYGQGAIHGDASLFGRLKARGWTVKPDPFDGRETAGYNGGYIVGTYGSHQPIGVDAMQLEIGADYRSPANRAKTAATLTLAIAEYAKEYLGVVPAEKAAPKKDASQVPAEKGPMMSP